MSVTATQATVECERMERSLNGNDVPQDGTGTAGLSDKLKSKLKMGRS